MESTRESQEVPSTPRQLCDAEGCNETAYLNGLCSNHSHSAQRSRELHAQRNPASTSSQEQSQEGRGSSVKASQAQFFDTHSDFKKRVQAFLVMKAYCHFTHEKQMSIDDRANKCLKEYRTLAELWVNKTDPFYSLISKVFGLRASSVTADLLMKKSTARKQAEEDIDSAWMKSKLRDIKTSNPPNSAAKSLGSVVGVCQKQYAPLMNRLLPKDTIPASGKNYAYYYDLVRRFQYLTLCDPKSASDMKNKGDPDFRSSLEENDVNVPEAFVPQ